MVATGWQAVPPASAQVGDVVGTPGTGPGGRHLAIYAGNGQIVSGPGKPASYLGGRQGFNPSASSVYRPPSGRSTAAPFVPAQVTNSPLSALQPLFGAPVVSDASYSGQYGKGGIPSASHLLPMSEPTTTAPSVLTPQPDESWGATILHGLEHGYKDLRQIWRTNGLTGSRDPSTIKSVTRNLKASPTGVATANALYGNMAGPGVAGGAVIGVTERGANKILDKLHIPYDKGAARRRIAALGVHPGDTVGNMLIKQVPQVVMDIAHNNYGPPGTKHVPILPEIKKNIQGDPVGTTVSVVNGVATLVDGINGMREGIGTIAKVPHVDPELLPDKPASPRAPHSEVPPPIPKRPVKPSEDVTAHPKIPDKSNINQHPVKLEAPVKAGAFSILERRDPVSSSDAKDQLPEQQATFGTSTSKEYAETFFKKHPELRGKVWVHHAVPQKAWKLYGTEFTEKELHSYENLRGIPIEVNREVHLKQIGSEWRKFYEDHPNATRAQLLQKASEIDTKYGVHFLPGR